MIELERKITAASELRRALQYLLATLDPDEDLEKIISVPTAFSDWAVGVPYKTKDVFKYGQNAVGDPQLYQVLQPHTSQAQWTPDAAVSLYKKIGIADDGTPEWTQPLGATDAYNTGDVVMYNGEKYKSLIDANVWSPDAYPAGWEKIS